MMTWRPDQTGLDSCRIRDVKLTEAAEFSCIGGALSSITDSDFIACQQDFCTALFIFSFIIEYRLRNSV